MDHFASKTDKETAIAYEEDGWDLVTCLNCDWSGKALKGTDVCPMEYGGCGHEGALTWTSERIGEILENEGVR